MSEESQGTNPFLLSYSDLMAALLLAFIIMLTSTMLKIQQDKEQQEEQAERITLVKDEIIQDLSAAFADHGITIEIDSLTGVITFSEEDVHFESGSSDLMDEGKDLLSTVMPIYLDVLLAPEYEDDIVQIIVEGHTDPQPFRGSGRNGSRYSTAYMDNLGLSHRRAQSVVEFVLNLPMNSLAEEEGYTNLMGCGSRLRRLLTANGASFSRPLDSLGNPVTEVPYETIAAGEFSEDSSPIDFDRSRRVEIQFRLNDEQYLREIREILAEEEAERS